MSVATFTVRLAGADCASGAQSLERILTHAPGVAELPSCCRAHATVTPTLRAALARGPEVAA